MVGKVMVAEAVTPIATIDMADIFITGIARPDRFLSCVTIGLSLSGPTFIIRRSCIKPRRRMDTIAECRRSFSPGLASVSV